MPIIDMKPGDKDENYNTILSFYSKKAPLYAVYLCPERVMVAYSDDPATAASQRKQLSILAPFRSEITALLDGNRSDPADLDEKAAGARRHHLNKLMASYDERVAFALIVALEGDPAAASAVFKDLRDEILATRTAQANMITILCGALFTIFIIAVITCFAPAANGLIMRASSHPVLMFDHSAKLGAGAITGAIGALFSVAISLSGRTVNINDYFVNAADAMIRIFIGFLAGTVICALFAADFFRINLGTTSHGEPQLLYWAIAGLMGGFSEQLVPDLLNKTAQSIEPVPPGAAPERRAEIPAKDPAAAKPPAADGPPPAPDPAPAAADTAPDDGCNGQHHPDDADITDDAHLPAASGGVTTIAAGGPGQ
jgi:hypothetical protein